MSAHLTATLRRTVTRSEDVTSATVKAMLASLANVWQMCRGKCVCVCVCVCVCLSVCPCLCLCLSVCMRAVSRSRGLSQELRAPLPCAFCVPSRCFKRAHTCTYAHTRVLRPPTACRCQKGNTIERRRRPGGHGAAHGAGAPSGAPSGAPCQTMTSEA